jgi:hypothetical protein
MSYEILETPDSIIVKGKGPEMDHLKLLLRGNSIPASTREELIEPFNPKMVYPVRGETRITLDRAAVLLTYQALFDIRDARKLNGLEDRLLTLTGRKLLEAKDRTKVKGASEHDKPKSEKYDKRLENQI